MGMSPKAEQLSNMCKTFLGWGCGKFLDLSCLVLLSETTYFWRRSVIHCDSHVSEQGVIYAKYWLTGMSFVQLFLMSFQWLVILLDST